MVLLSNKLINNVTLITSLTNRLENTTSQRPNYINSKNQKEEQPAENLQTAKKNKLQVNPYYITIMPPPKPDPQNQTSYHKLQNVLVKLVIILEPS
jgi:hypothetical protein